MAGKNDLDSDGPMRSLDNEQILLQTILDAIPDVIGIQDRHHRIIRYNEAGYDLLGKTQKEVFGKKCFSLVGRSSPCEICATSTAYDVKLPTRVERYEESLGKWLDVRAYPVLDDNNEIIYIIEHLRDITREKKAEKALVQSESKFKNLVESTTDWIWEVDEKGRYTYCSPKVKDLIGYDPDEMIGKSPLDLMESGSKKKIANVMEGLLSDPKPFHGLENLNIHKNGSIVTIETSGVPLFDHDGKFKGLRGIDRDITEREKAITELEFRLKFENVLSTISTDFITMPVETIDEAINNALEKIGNLVDADRSYIFLYRENGTKMDNTHEWCRKGIEPAIDELKDLDPLKFYMVKRVLQTRSDYQISSLSELPDEAKTDMVEFEREGIRSIVLVPMFLGSKDLGFIGFDSVREEREWSQDTIRILKMVGGIISSAIHRKRTQEEMKKERNRAELYLDLLGHDIGNLHQGIYTSIQLAKMKKDIPGAMDEAMNHAEDITKKSMMLVKSVLLLSKLRSQDTDLSEIKLCESIKQAVSTIETVFSNRNIQLELKCGEGPFRIMAEPVISELFFNLFHNGIKFQMGDEPKIEVTVETVDGNVVVKICDHGPGIADSMKGVIFQRFNSGGSGSHSGLGLSLVSALVDRYNGSIEITDRIHGDHTQGACFTVIFPGSRSAQ